MTGSTRGCAAASECFFLSVIFRHLTETRRARFPKTSALDHASALVRVGVAAYYLSYTGPVHLVASFRGTLASVVLLDGLSSEASAGPAACRTGGGAAGVKRLVVCRWKTRSRKYLADLSFVPRGRRARALTKVLAFEKASTLHSHQNPSPLHLLLASRGTHCIAAPTPRPAPEQAASRGPQVRSRARRV